MKRGRNPGSRANLEQEVLRLNREVETLQQDAEERLAEYRELEGAADRVKELEQKCCKYRMMLVNLISDIDKQIVHNIPTGEDVDESDIVAWGDRIRGVIEENSVIPTDGELEDWAKLPGGTERLSMLLDFVYRDKDEETTLQWLAEAP